MDLASLLQARSDEVVRDDSPLLRTFWRIADRWDGAAEAERAALLLAAAQADEPEALAELETLAGLAGWAPAWQHGEDRVVCHRRLRGHGVGVCCLAFGTIADQPVLASADQSGELRLWNPRRGTLLRAFPAHEVSVTALAFFPELPGLGGSSPALLVTGGSDGEVRCWNPETGAMLAAFTVEGSPRAFALARGALAVGWENRARGGVAIWTPDTGELRANVFPAMRSMEGLVALGDALVAATPTCIDIRDAGTFTRIAALEQTAWHCGFVRPLGKVMLNEVPTIACAVDDVFLDPADPDQTFVCVSGSGEQLGEWSEAGAGRALAFGDRAQLQVAIVHERGTVHVLGHDYAWLRGHSSAVTAASFGELDGQRVLATADEGFEHEGRHHEGTVIVWDLPRHGDKGHVASACGISPVFGSGRPLIVFGSEYMTEVADARTGEVLHSTIHDWDRDESGLSVTAAVVGDALLVACAGESRGIGLWEAGSSEWGHIEPGWRVLTLAFGSLDGRLVLAAGSYGARAKVYDPTTREHLLTLAETGDWGTKAIAFGSVEGQSVIAVGGRTGLSRLELWNAEGRRLHCFGRYGEAMAMGTIAGQTVLAGSSGLETRVWDLGALQPITTMTHRVPLTCAAMIGHLLVTGDLSGRVELWDARLGRRLSTLGAFAQRVRAVTAIAVNEGVHVYAQSGRGRVTACRLDEWMI